MTQTLVVVHHFDAHLLFTALEKIYSLLRSALVTSSYPYNSQCHHHTLGLVITQTIPPSLSFFITYTITPQSYISSYPNPSYLSYYNASHLCYYNPSHLSYYNASQFCYYNPSHLSYYNPSHLSYYNPSHLSYPNPPTSVITTLPTSVITTPPTSVITTPPTSVITTPPISVITTLPPQLLQLHSNQHHHLTDATPSHATVKPIPQFPLLPPFPPILLFLYLYSALVI